MNDTEKEAIIGALKLLEGFANDIPAPGNILAIIALRSIEADIAAGIIPGAEQLEKMRADVYGGLQAQLVAKFG